MRVSDLRDALNARGLSSTGLKAALRDRLLKAVRKSATNKGGSSAASAAQALSGGALSASMEQHSATRAQRLQRGDGVRGGDGGGGEEWWQRKMMKANASTKVRG